MDRVDIPALLRSQQDLLEARLGLSEGFSHPTARGDVKEFNWVQMLTDFLPSRYQVSRGAFIIDSDGRRSSEIDLVIHDNYFHPQLFEAATRRLIPAESVYAIFEIKPKVDKANLKYAIRKTAEVRRLHRTNLPIRDARGDIREPREALTITSGILASRGTWKDPFGPQLKKHLEAAPMKGRLDLGFAVGDGAFDVEYEKKTASVEIEAQDNGLLFFLTRLNKRLLQGGSVPAIDLGAYQSQIPHLGT